MIKEGVLKLYINGKLDLDKKVGEIENKSKKDIRINGWNDKSKDRGFKGGLDKMQLHNRALTESEV